MKSKAAKSPATANVTVHLIFNSHIDPVWLWGWDAGLDAALATFRSACDRLDEYPELLFSNGDAWALWMVERCDPELFGRIKAHAASGRWSLYGGWWVQPDCNGPTKEGFEHQISLGREFIESRFGKFSDIGRNVDSFGHSAVLPEVMRAAGQTRYIMMRPQPHEMKLPARLFKWRGFKGGPEVLTFRIANTYCTWSMIGEEDLIRHIKASAENLPHGIDDTMCFLGVGDHGGGPTKRQIEACLKLRDSIPGLRLEFSTPERFFDAVERAKGADIPSHTGELQYHAVGCYTIARKLKTLLKKAEHTLEQAMISQKRLANAETSESELVKDAWRKVCFNQFHDTYGGTCLPSDYETAEAQAGGALATADEILRANMRAILPALGKDKAQRIILLNASELPFDGHIEFSPWFAGWRCMLTPSTRLVDESGQDVPFQRVPHESTVNNCITLLLKARLKPESVKSIRIVEDSGGAAKDGEWRRLSPDCAVNKKGFGVDLSEGKVIVSGKPRIQTPRLQLIEDASDTWTHNYDRYFEGPCESPRWNSPFLLHHGAVAAGLSQTGRLDGQEIRSDILLHSDEAFYEMRLKVNWLSKLKVLKLVVPLPCKAVKRVDGIPGGKGIGRPLDGAELPLSDWMLLELEDGSKLGIVCPDVFALDADPGRVRLTLLRSPVMANHAPKIPGSELAAYSDHGVHKFRIGFDHSKGLSPESLMRRAVSWLRPPVCADLTKGMEPA